MTKLAEMKAALEAVTPWPWEHNPVAPLNVQDRHGLTVCSMKGARAAALEDFKAELNANAHLIVNAPEWLSKLLNVAEAAKDLTDKTEQYSRNTSFVYTDSLQALTKALEELNNE